ncbi:MAG: hypothetical protein JJV88_01500, partial [Sulfurovum sp.]|nr:hypothetical protein [Sulfurovaceae bacterium]
MKTYLDLLQLAQDNLFSKKADLAVKYGEEAHKLRDDDYRLYDILAEAYMLIKDFENSIIAGAKALILKDKLTNKYKSYPSPTSLIKPFTENRDKNIISFSLFGDNPKYTFNAIINAKFSKKIYPFWRCRFYCDNLVPVKVIGKLRALDAEVIIKKTIKDDKPQMLLWRFLVMSDISIDRYLVRDCDSVINIKESLAVDDWIKSEKRFHIMRDFYTHTDLILAGMFGGTTDIFLDIQKMIKRFHEIKNPLVSHQDQLFLRVFIWQTIKDNVLIHDRCFRLKNTTEFPPHPKQLKYEHIGQNEGKRFFDMI